METLAVRLAAELLDNAIATVSLPHSAGGLATNCNEKHRGSHQLSGTALTTELVEDDKVQAIKPLSNGCGEVEAVFWYLG